MTRIDVPYSLLGIMPKGKIGIDMGGGTPPEWGIWQTRPRSPKRISVRMKFYEPTNPRTVKQQANRQKFADGVVAWQALTASQKRVYNVKARSYWVSGFNLFLREYMLN